MELRNLKFQSSDVYKKKDDQFCSCSYKILREGNKCSICDKVIQDVQQFSSTYETSGKCMSREENINNITQCMILNILENIYSLTSKKNRSQKDVMTDRISRIFKDFVQGKVVQFINDVRDANIKKNMLRKNHLISLISYLILLVINTKIFISKLEVKKLIKKCQKNTDMKLGKNIYLELLSSEDHTFQPINLEQDKYTYVRGIINRIILNECYPTKESLKNEFFTFIRDNIKDIYEEMYLIHDNIIFKPFCTRQTIIQIIIFFMYKLIHIDLQMAKSICENPEVFLYYLFGKGAQKKIYESGDHSPCMCASTYCGKLGINATVFTRRASKVLHEITSTKLILSLLTKKISLAKDNQDSSLPLHQ